MAQKVGSYGDNYIEVKDAYKEFVTANSLVIQWLRVCQPMQGPWVQSLVWEDSTCCRAAKAHGPQLLSPRALEPVLHNKRSHSNEKASHRN